MTGKGCGGDCSKEGKSGCGDKAKGTSAAAGETGHARLAAATTQPACGGKKDKDQKCGGCSGKGNGTTALGAGEESHARLASATSQPACGGKKDKDQKCGGCSGKANGTTALGAGEQSHARLAAAEGKADGCGGNCASKDGKACAKGDQCCKVTGKGCGGDCSKEGKSGCGDKAKGTSAAAGESNHARLAAATTQPACGGKKDKDEKSCCGKCGGDKPKPATPASVRPVALTETDAR